MKKLLIFGYTLDMGGAEKALVDMVKYLHRRVSIDLYLLEKKGPLLKEIPKDVNVYQMKNNFFTYCLFRFVPMYRKWYINKIVNKKNYYAVFGYMEGRCGTWVADISKRIKKYAWIHNDVFKFDIGISDKEIRHTYNSVSKVICVSKESRDNFCQKYNISKEKVMVIYNYIDEDEILKKSLEFKVNNEKFTFVNVAKMRDQKRQDRLIMAAKYLKEKGYDFELQLIGDGPNLEKIKDMVYNYKLEDVVKILGLKTNPYPYVKAADYFVFSSFMEGYGIVIKEALLLKTKIITTDVVGPREILENGKYGIIVPNDDKSIGPQMEDVMVHPEKYIFLDKNIDAYVGDNESIMHQVFDLLDL